MAEQSTFGIEEEFFLTDLNTRNIVRRRPKGFFRACKSEFGGLVMPELLQSQLELVTPILTRMDDARNCLLSARTRLGVVTETFGLGALAAGTHPMAQWHEQQATELPHYEQLFADFQMVARRDLLCGLHVHVGVPEHLDRIVVMNRVMPWLPLLLALSSASPFWARKRTGLMSYRQSAYDEWPRTGIPDYFQDESSYRAYVDFLMATGSMKSDSDIRWSIRPSARFPTLELRIADSCPAVDDVLCIAALFRAMVNHAVVTPGQGLMHNGMSRLLIEENRWRAKRFGTQAAFLDQASRRNVPIEEWLDMLQAQIGESAEALGDSAAFVQAKTILHTGSSADRQLRCYTAARTAGLSRQRALIAVVDELLAVTRSGKIL